MTQVATSSRAWCHLSSVAFTSIQLKAAGWTTRLNKLPGKG
jgi:hypothetical protein